MTQQTYWMADEPEELASKLAENDTVLFAASSNPIYQTWVKNLYYYYSNVLDSQSSFTALGFTGDQGELVQMRVPQARSLIRQLLTLCTKQKLAFGALASNSERSVVEEMRIADAICENTVKDKTVDVRAEKMVEHGLVIGTGYIYLPWRTDRGMPFTTDKDGNVVFEGDVDVIIPSITDVLHDFSKEEWDDNDWFRIRVRRNRWNLIAQFPELAEEIKALPSASSVLYGGGAGLWYQNDDDVFVYDLYHRPTPALPQGRMMFYSSPETIYHDGENLYGCCPIEQYKPETISNIAFGYPMFSSLLPAQEMFDHEMSCIATNHSALGVHNVTVPKDSGFSVKELNGMNFISYVPQNVPGGGKPEGLNLMQASPEAFKLMDTLLANMQQISNVNGALRGDIGADTSGVAIATLTTNALEFMSPYIKSYYKTMERAMYHVVNAHTRFAKTERTVELVGKDRQTYVKKYIGEQLRAIKSIKIQEVNPLMQTLAGRLEIADRGAKNGYITSMKDFCAVLDGEPVSKLFEADQSNSDLISTENQMLLDGKVVKATFSENHPDHMYKHSMLLTPEAKESDPELVKRVNDHILEHFGLAVNTDPRLLAMCTTGKMPEMPQGAPPPAPMGGPGMEPSQPTAEPAQPAADMLRRA